MIKILLICLILSGCAWSPKDNLFIGWGKAIRNDEGKVVEIVSDPPIKVGSIKKE